MAEQYAETLSEIDAAAEPEVGPPQPHLVRVFEAERPLAPPARHALGGLDAVAIGRGARAWTRDPRARLLRIALPDPRMSSAHARLVRRGGAWAIEDAGSRNGTLVNGAEVSRAPLADGDLLELGRTWFLFRAAASAAASDPPDVEATALPAAVAELASLSLPLARELRRLVQVAAHRRATTCAATTSQGWCATSGSSSRIRGSTTTRGSRSSRSPGCDHRPADPRSAAGRE